MKILLAAACTAALALAAIGPAAAAGHDHGGGSGGTPTEAAPPPDGDSGAEAPDTRGITLKWHVPVCRETLRHDVFGDAFTWKDCS